MRGRAEGPALGACPSGTRRKNKAMPENSLGIKLLPIGDPERVIEQPETVNADDLLKLVVNPGVTDRLVELQPGTSSEDRLLALQSELLRPQLNLKANEGISDSQAVVPLGPQVHGNGSTALFPAPQRSLKFSNGHPTAQTTKRARVQVLVGRNATH